MGEGQPNLEGICLRQLVHAVGRRFRLPARDRVACGVDCHGDGVVGHVEVGVVVAALPDDGVERTHLRPKAEHAQVGAVRSVVTPVEGRVHRAVGAAGGGVDAVESVARGVVGLIPGKVAGGGSGTRGQRQREQRGQPAGEQRHGYASERCGTTAGEHDDPHGSTTGQVTEGSCASLLVGPASYYDTRPQVVGPSLVPSCRGKNLVVVLENGRADRLDEDVSALGGLLEELGAIDVYVLPLVPAVQLLDARQKAFWLAKQFGANDIVDVVVPRASIPGYLATVSRLAQEHATTVVGAGHAGDGNVHLSIFQSDAEKRDTVMRAIFEAGLAFGGAISAEHGIGTEKKPYFLTLEDPAKIRLMRGIKLAFDPHGILNPGTLLTSTGDPP